MWECNKASVPSSAPNFLIHMIIHKVGEREREKEVIGSSSTKKSIFQFNKYIIYIFIDIISHQIKLLVQDRKPTRANKQPSKNKQWQLRNKVGQEKDETPRAETQMHHLVYILQRSENLNAPRYS